MYNPVSTYRLQFNKEFTLHDLEGLIGYFKNLGIKTIYASPIFKAVPGSMHGYDVVNPYEVNPEIGDIDQLRKVITKLKAEGIGWIQDIVPNHMAFHHTNPWLLDVLEKGSVSVYADFFDVTWASQFFHSRVMVPFLDGSIDDVIQKNELTVVYWQNRLCFKYGELYFPLNSRSYADILQQVDPAGNIGQFLDQVDGIHHITDGVQYALRWHELLLQFASFMNDSDTSLHIVNALAGINKNADQLKKISEAQFYRLCHWNETDKQINYRRFFLVNGLICLNMQSEKVFARYHEAVYALVQEGLFEGLRVDHIDGLFDPTEYLRRLRNLCGPDCYIIVEKILEPAERLESKWPIQGTTGYEFLSTVNNLLTRNSAENKFSSIYRTITADNKSIGERIREKKTLILARYMQGELNNLCRLFIEQYTGDHPMPEYDLLKESIAEFLIHVPVYRYYANEFPLKGNERLEVERIIARCIAEKPHLRSVFDATAQALMGDASSSQFYMRSMQFTGPLMAKGVEDTLMYTFNRFVGHNEVGDSPEFFGISVEEFHQSMKDRQQYWPLSLNATSTHDTKRGEDVRTRLNVLPDIAGEWIENVRSWVEINKPYKSNGAPDPNDEYFIYQNLIGVYPFRYEENLEERLKAYLTKAMREAKRYSDWTNPDNSYETAVMNFVHAILTPGSPFINSFKEFQRKVADFGVINSITQCILKFTCPGVPDTYQGTTHWDLTLVDPDNRRKVDYTHEIDQLNELADTNEDVLQQWWSSREDGKIKLWITRRLLELRIELKDLFAEGAYIPLEVEGRRADNCIAFARKKGDQWVVIAVPLSVARIGTVSDDAVEIDWENTRIILPAQAPTEWKHQLWKTDGKHRGEILLSDIFTGFPAAVLLLTEKRGVRDAGILLPLSSLPSAFGVGDMGPAARSFSDFLSNSRQRIWQLLPLNPIDMESSYSPYSSYAAMAGNTLFISLEDLIQMDLLQEDELEAFKVKNRGEAAYTKASFIKLKLLRKAYERFEVQQSQTLKKEFEAFTEKESYWLDDFALFQVIREDQSNLPWYSWPLPLKDRHDEALGNIVRNNGTRLRFIKWMQFIFHYQWKRLKKYCNDRGIRMFGDLPFYVSHNSVDVWSHRDLFKVDGDGRIQGIAGVPPDYFAATGQLWGMPVFRWDALKQQNYSWFVDRILKNLELFDILRLDHFRAFTNYWEVPSGETTAIGGKWMDGPSTEIFKVLKEKIGHLPFIAEDLGDITPAVYALRDELGLAGMKVLQFAFGDNMAETPYIPHHHSQNFIVYTGTHDNNTTRGWYRKDIANETRKRIDTYCNKRLSAGTISNEFVRLAYSSVANTAIIPLQDILNLNERYRLNTPSTAAEKNWRWRLTEIPDEDIENSLVELTRIYDR